MRSIVSSSRRPGSRIRARKARSKGTAPPLSRQSRRHGGNIVKYGTGPLDATLMRHGLIDEFQRGIGWRRYSALRRQMGGSCHVRNVCAGHITSKWTESSSWRGRHGLGASVPQRKVMHLHLGGRARRRTSAAHVGKTTLRFPLDQPLPRAAIRRLIQQRVTTNEAQGTERGTRKRALTMRLNAESHLTASSRTVGVSLSPQLRGVPQHGCPMLAIAPVADAVDETPGTAQRYRQSRRVLTGLVRHLPVRTRQPHHFDARGRGRRCLGRAPR